MLTTKPNVIQSFILSITATEREETIAAKVIDCLADIQDPQSGLVMEAIRSERQRRIYAASYKRVRKLPVR